MVAYILWSVFIWTFKGILCTCRFLWLCPYNAIKFLPREQQITEDTSYQPKQLTGSEGKVSAAIPGSPDRTIVLHKRLTKTEKDILSLKTRIACERASCKRRFTELQLKQEALTNQLASETVVLVKVGSYDEQSVVDNGEVFEEGSSSSSSTLSCPRTVSEASPTGDICERSQFSLSVSDFRSTSVLSLTTSMGSWMTSPGLHRVFVPHSPMDLQVGHRVRVMLPSGRISTGTIRFLGRLQGEAELHLGVELQIPDHGLQDGSHRGHSYFECKPGYGVFVPFSKLLMAWE